jgi:nicotinamide riboside transporter PnuC
MEELLSKGIELVGGWLEVIGLISGFLELVGLYLLGKRKAIGFLINLLGNIGWIYFCFVTQSAWGLVLVCMAALYLNIKGYLFWTRPSKENKDEFKEAN